MVDTCISSPCYDPGPGSFRCLQETFPEDPLELRLEVKVEDPTVDRDEKLGQIQAPLGL